MGFCISLPSFHCNPNSLLPRQIQARPVDSLRTAACFSLQQSLTPLTAERSRQYLTSHHRQVMVWLLRSVKPQPSSLEQRISPFRESFKAPGAAANVLLTHFLHWDEAEQLTRCNLCYVQGSGVALTRSHQGVTGVPQEPSCSSNNTQRLTTTFRA